jgi:hypothetical protein
MIDITTALVSLKPNAQWVLRGDEIEWLDTEQTQPTNEELQTEIARLTYLYGIEQYQRDRQYPPVEEQLDTIYHNGVDVWKSEIEIIKNETPKVEPNEEDQAAFIADHLNQWTFNTQATDYRTATARIAQYQLSVGRPEVTEMMPTGEQVFNEETDEMEDVLEEVIVQTAIEPLEPTVEITVYDEEDPEAEPTTETVPNPLIVADDAERAEAQTVIDNTPEPVKEHVDNE